MNCGFPPSSMEDPLDDPQQLAFFLTYFLWIAKMQIADYTREHFNRVVGTQENSV